MQLDKEYAKPMAYHEALAEKVGISTTHMSHIETGNTKRSLPVFVDLVEVLEVRTDELLCDNSTAECSVS